MTKHSVLVIGLDAATFEIISPLINQGKLPHMQSLIADGSSGPLASTHPPISPAAWTSFMTGKNPASHGIFDFKNYDPTSYDRRAGHLVNATQFAGTTIFDIASSAGRKVGVFKMPITYPAWPVNGFMVSGQPLPDIQTQPSIYPPSLAEDLGDHSPAFDRHVDLITKEALDKLIEGIQRSNENSLSQVLELLATDDYDLFVLVLTALDEVQHRLWMFTDPNCPVYDAKQNARYGKVIAGFYCRMDEAVGQILSRWRHADDGLVFIVSDHGARLRPLQLVNVNSWLRDRGWLTLAGANSRQVGRLQRLYNRAKRLAPTGLRTRLRSRLPQKGQAILSNLGDGEPTVDWGQTRAYFFQMYCPLGGIEINLRGRQPQGIVEPGTEYEQIRAAILAQLQEFTDPVSGRRIITRASRREDLYSGPFLERVPDIVFFLDDHYDTGWNLTGDLVIPTPDKAFHHWSGYHSPQGVLVAWGRDVVRRGAAIQDAELTDMAPTLLYSLGLPIPEEMDGKVLTDLFEPDIVTQRPPTYTDIAPQPLSAEHVLTAEEEQEIMHRLQALGYLE